MHASVTDKQVISKPRFLSSQHDEFVSMPDQQIHANVSSVRLLSNQNTQMPIGV